MGSRYFPLLSHLSSPPLLLSSSLLSPLSSLLSPFSFLTSSLPPSILISKNRSGDIDAGVLDYYTTKTGKSVQEAVKMLNTQSGMKGLCGSNDMREVVKMMKEGNDKVSQRREERRKEEKIEENQEDPNLATGEASI